MSTIPNQNGYPIRYMIATVDPQFFEMSFILPPTGDECLKEFEEETVESIPYNNYGEANE